MATEAQFAANRANSQKSTGPVSSTGKYASCQNGMKYNLSGKYNTFVFLKDEDPAEFEELLANLRSEHEPKTETEKILVRRMAQSEFLRCRAQRIPEAALNFAHLSSDAAQKELSLLMRYQTMHERAFNRSLAELQKLRKEKRNEQIGFASQKLKEATAERAAEALNLKKRELELKKARFERQQTPSAKPSAVESEPQILKTAA